MVKNSKTIKALLSLYILLCASLFCYLYLIRFETIQYGEYIFWSLVTSIYLILIVQIFITEFKGKLEALMLLQLVIFSLLLNSIFQLPFALTYGSDSSMEEYVVKTLISNGHITLDLNTYSFWPIVHIYGAIVYHMTNLDLNSVIKYVPSFFTLTVVPLIYVFFRQALGKSDQKYTLAFLATLFFICLYNRILFGAIFVRQGIAIPFFLLIIYLFYIRSNFSEKNTKILISILMIGIVFAISMAHHFTSFLLLIFLIIISLHEFFEKRSVDQMSGFFILCGVIIISYWAYIAIAPLMTLGTFTQSLINPVTTDPTYSQSTHINNLRDYVILFGFFFFNGIFASILLLKYKKIKDNQVFVLFLFLCGIGGIISFFGSQSIYPDRFLMFGWLFGTIALILAIYKIDNSKIKKICLGLFIIFFFYNIYQIEPAVYSEPQNVLSQPTLENFALINNINMTNGTILSTSRDISVVWSIYGNTRTTSATDLDLLNTNLNRNYTYYKFVIVDNNLNQIPIDIETKHKLNIYQNYVSKIDKNPDFNYQKIADSNNVSIYIRRNS